MDHRLMAAVANNAAWCETVSQAHGISTARTAGWWVSLSAPPAYHPDAVSLRPDLTGLPELLVARPHRSVKDSFATLDLSRFAMEVLLEARWIAREAAVPGTARWSAVTTLGQLERWRAAHGDAPAITAGLLTDPDVVLLADQSWTSGLIANRGAGAVGISNMFGSAGWTEGVNAAGNHFPGLPLVGWERGEEDLRAALAVGFDDLGPLRVWVSS